MSKIKLILMSAACLMALGTLTGCGEDDPVAVHLQPTKAEQEASKQFRKAPDSFEEFQKQLQKRDKEREEGFKKFNQK